MARRGSRKGGCCHNVDLSSCERLASMQTGLEASKQLRSSYCKTLRGLISVQYCSSSLNRPALLYYKLFPPKLLSTPWGIDNPLAPFCCCLIHRSLMSPTRWTSNTTVLPQSNSRLWMCWRIIPAPKKEHQSQKSKKRKSRALTNESCWAWPHSGALTKVPTHSVPHSIPHTTPFAFQVSVRPHGGPTSGQFCGERLGG